MKPSMNTRPFPDTPNSVCEMVLPKAVAETLRNIYGDAKLLESLED